MPLRRAAPMTRSRDEPTERSQPWLVYLALIALVAGVGY